MCKNKSNESYQKYLDKMVDEFVKDMSKECDNKIKQRNIQKKQMNTQKKDNENN